MSTDRELLDKADAAASKVLAHFHTPPTTDTGIRSILQAAFLLGYAAGIDRGAELLLPRKATGS